MHYVILLSNFQPGSISSMQLFQNADETHCGTRSKTAATGYSHKRTCQVESAGKALDTQTITVIRIN